MGVKDTAEIKASSISSTRGSCVICPAKKVQSKIQCRFAKKIFVDITVLSFAMNVILTKKILVKTKLYFIKYVLLFFYNLYWFFH